MLREVTLEYAPIELVWLDPASVSPNPDNWRRTNPLAAQALTERLDSAGWAGAALFNRRTGRLIDGHLGSGAQPRPWASWIT